MIPYFLSNLNFLYLECWLVCCDESLAVTRDPGVTCHVAWQSWGHVTPQSSWQRTWTPTSPTLSPSSSCPGSSAPRRRSEAAWRSSSPSAGSGGARTDAPGDRNCFWVKNKISWWKFLIGVSAGQNLINLPELWRGWDWVFCPAQSPAVGIELVIN